MRQEIKAGGAKTKDVKAMKAATYMEAMYGYGSNVWRTER